MAAPERGKCPQCGHPVFQQMAKCLYCGREQVDRRAQPVRGCPRCRRTLEVVTLRWVAIDRCPGCHGEYYDTGEVDPQLDLAPGEREWVMSHAEPAPHDTPQGKAMDCPGCRGPMGTWRVPGPDPVVVDVCPACNGTWLDAGEVGRLRAAARARIVPKEVVDPVLDPEAAATTPAEDSEDHSVFGALKEIVDILRGRR